MPPVDGALQGGDTGLQQLVAVLRGDDDRDGILREERRIPVQLVEAERVILHQRRQDGRGLQSAALHAVVDGAAGGVEEVALLIALARGALGMGAPVVADLGHMHDALVAHQLDAA